MTFFRYTVLNGVHYVLQFGFMYVQALHYRGTRIIPSVMSQVSIGF